MRHSIHGAWHGILDIPAITNGDFGLGPQERQIWGMPLFEPKPEIPSMEDSSLPMFGGDLPAAGEPNSPEHIMAQWMRDRLTRSVVE